jgi:hypothetical protein
VQLGAVTLTIFWASVALAACGDGGGRPPEILMDGSPAPALRIELERIPALAVLTKVRVRDAATIPPRSLAATCLRGRARGVRPKGRVVERIGVHGESVTLRDASGLHSCDDSPGPGSVGRSWCGGAFGRLYGGHLRDPRLNIAGCTSADAEPVSFAWVEPRRRARYLAVAQPDYAEVYEVGGRLPVRIASIAVAEPDASGATFDLSEYDDSGKLVRRYQLDAVPAG